MTIVVKAPNDYEFETYEELLEYLKEAIDHELAEQED